MAATVGTLIISAITADAAVGTAIVVGTITVADVVGAAALVAASYALQAATAPGASLSSAKSQANLKQTVAPRRRYYGVAKIGGTYTFWRAQNGFFYLMLDLVDDQIGGIDVITLDDQPITLDGDGFVTDPASFTNGNVKRVRLFTELGTPTQAAFPIMVTDWPGVWTADHRLRGCAVALLVCQTVSANDFTAVYPNGEPTFLAEIRGALVFDPRLGNDPTVKTYSDNYALCLLDFMMHPDGMAIPLSIIAPSFPDWADRADDCDVQVPLAAGGTEARFRLWLGYEEDEARKTVLGRILDASGGRIVQRYDGAPILRLPDYAEPSVTLGDDVVSTFQQLRPGPDMGERYNEIRAKIVTRETAFVEDEAEPWQDLAAMAAEGTQSKMLDLTGCPSHRQARVRMKLEAYRAKPKWLGTAIANAYGMNAMGEPLVRLEKSSYSFNEVVEPTGLTVDPDTYATTIQFRSMPAAAFAWSVDEEGAGPSAQDPGTPDVIAQPEGMAADVEQQDFGGGVTAPTVTITVTPPDNLDLGLYVEWRTHDGAVSDDDADWTPLTVKLGDYRGTTTALPAATFDFRAQFVAPSALKSVFTYLRNVAVTRTGPAVITADDVGTPGGVATLDGSGKIPASQLPSSVVGGMVFQDVWNASTNSPAIPAAASGNNGWYWIVGTAGSTSEGGITDWKVGDWIVSNGVTYYKIDNTDAVISVAGKTGVVTLTAGDIAGLAGVATSGSATDLTTGTLPAARLPLPAAATLGGVKSLAAVAHKFLTSIDTATGLPVAAQPAAADLSDFEAPAVWAPADASGAGVALTVNSAKKWALGGFGVAAFDITVGASGSGTNALIGGLGHNVSNRIIMIVDDISATYPGMMLLPAPGAANFELYQANGTQLTWANLSGKRLIGCCLFLY